MNEWGVVLVLIAVAGFFVTVGAPVLKLNSTITRLQTLLGELKSEFDRLQHNSHETHKRLWEKSEAQQSRLAEHEKRITRLEQKEVAK